MKSIVHTYDEQGVPLKMFISQKCLKSKLKKLGRNSAKFMWSLQILKQEKLQLQEKLRPLLCGEHLPQVKAPAPLPTSQPIQRKSIKGFWVTDHLPLP